MSRIVDERLLSQIWKGQWIEGSNLCTVTGEHLQVIFPGRQSGDRGPDFQDVILALEDGRLRRGSAELHVNARDWIAHGHHRDAGYNSVVVHVTWEADLPRVEREDGAMIPTVPLSGCLSLPLEALMQMEEPEPPHYSDCREVARELGVERLGQVLDEIGEARFVGKGSQFQGDLSRTPPEEVLYQGLMRSLGYSKNTLAFERLAHYLPMSVIEGLTSGVSAYHRPKTISSLLLGVAGLLPCQEPKGVGMTVEGDELTGRWRNYCLCQEMNRGEWDTFRIRPANHPNNRILGAGHLLSRFMDSGLLEGLKGRLLEAHRSGDVRVLEGSLEVPRYLGRERVREMVVNVILPYYWALGEYQSDDVLCRVSLEMFHNYPLCRDNHVTRQVKLQLLQGDEMRTVNSACRQQGLVQLSKGPCRYGHCPSCPLGTALSSRDGAEVLAPSPVC